AAADRIEVLAARRDGQPIAVVHQRMIPEGIAFDAGLGGARRDSAAEAHLGLRAEALVAEQEAGVVAAADGVIAGREFLEAQQRLPRILSAQAEREGHLRCWAELTRDERAEDGGGRPPFDPARRHVVGAEAI